MKMEEIAKLFHDNYEGLAGLYNYETRAGTKRFDKESPNGRLMISTCHAVFNQLIDDGVICVPPTREEWKQIFVDFYDDKFVPGPLLNFVISRLRTYSQEYFNIIKNR